MSACPSRSDANVERKVREETGRFAEQQTLIVNCTDMMTIYQCAAEVNIGIFNLNVNAPLFNCLCMIQLGQLRLNPSSREIRMGEGNGVASVTLFTLFTYRTLSK